MRLVSLKVFLSGLKVMQLSKPIRQGSDGECVLYTYQSYRPGEQGRVGSGLHKSYPTMLVLWILLPSIIGCYFNAPQCLPRGEFPLILPLTKLVQELSCNLRPSHADSAAPRASFLYIIAEQTDHWYSSDYRFSFMVRALLATWAVSI